MEDENILYEDRQYNISFYTPFVEERRDIDRSSALNSIKMLFELLHTHVADIHFFKKSVASSKYCLLIVDLLTFQNYTYPMKNKSLLAKKLEIFYQDIEAKKKTCWFRKQNENSNGSGN